MLPVYGWGTRGIPLPGATEFRIFRNAVKRTDRIARMTKRTENTLGRTNPSRQVVKHQKVPAQRKSHAGMEILLLILLAACLTVLVGFYLHG